jgi:hypothetical protein
VAQRSHQLYGDQILAQIESDNYGKIVVIDSANGNFEVTEDSLTSTKQLLLRNPNAQIFCIRIGHRAVHRLGFYIPIASL